MSKTNPLIEDIPEHHWPTLPDLKIRRVAPPIKNVSLAAKQAMFDKFQRLICLTEDEIFSEFTRLAIASGYFISTHKDDWVIAQHIIAGVKPIFITAHVDTVRHDKTRPDLVLDKDNWCIQADKPAIIGADDIIMELLTKMKDMSVIFCLFNYEESGGGFGLHGSSLFSASTDDSQLNDARLFIGLDRQGFDEYVTYDYDNTEIDVLMNHLGYTKAYGSFSDVTCLADATNTACVNLSAGFTGEHTNQETGWLYPVFRAIETIPQLYSALENKIYPADEFGYGDDLGYDEREDIQEFIDELYFYGETSVKGYALSIDNVYDIVNGYIESHKLVFGSNKKRKHLHKMKFHDEPRDYLTSFVPF
jgi:hypothetical protein